MTEHYDIIVSGAGMVGSAVCCALADSGLDIAVIERKEPVTEWPADSIDLRVSAITGASEQIFKSLEVWQAMTAYGISPFRDMHVWDAQGHGDIHFDSADIGAARLGHIIENRVIQASLLMKMRQHDNVTLLCPASIQSFSTGCDHVSVRLEDDRVINARLLIGADGGQSQVRRLAGIETSGWDYQQQALVATVSTELPHRETAWQRFMPDGPLAFLPLADGRSSIVWSTTPKHAQTLLAMDEHDFLDSLTDAFERRLGRVVSSSPRATFPLRLSHSRYYVAPRLALIGDAAHTIHPLAGQGVNLGLLDAATLADVIDNALRHNNDIGSLKVLRRYERWRKGDNLLTMCVMDGFKRLFGSSNATLSWLRNSGLMISDSITPLKNRIMRHALGVKGDLPKLARPGYCR